MVQGGGLWDPLRWVETTTKVVVVVISDGAAAEVALQVTLVTCGAHK